MRKSMGVVNWLKASTDAALTLQPASAQASAVFTVPVSHTTLAFLPRVRLARALKGKTMHAY